MKKLFAILLTFALLLSLAACGNSADDAPAAGADGDAATDNENPGTEGDDNAAGDQDAGTADGSTSSSEKYEGTGYRFAPPADWTATEQSGIVMFTSPDYPANANNITIAISEKDASFNDYTEEMFTELYANIFEEVSFTTFEYTEIAGHNGLLLAYSLTLEGQSMTQYQYLIDAPTSSITFTFTEVESDITAIMQDAIDSLEIL